MTLIEESSLPAHGFKIPLDYEFPYNWNPYLKVTFRQIMPYIMTGIRFLFLRVKLWFLGKRPYIDMFRPKVAKQLYGVPLGGIGSGTIGRGFRGEFCRYQLSPGLYDYGTIEHNQFIVSIRDESDKVLYQKVLTPSRTAPRGIYSSWEWGEDLTGEYCGLYPRSWTVLRVPDPDVVLNLRQISPVIPNNYKDSCLPVGVFVWDAVNLTSLPLRISVALFVRNGTPDTHANQGECHSSEHSSTSMTCVSLKHTIRCNDVTTALATSTKGTISGSICADLLPGSDGGKVWQQLHHTGELWRHCGPGQGVNLSVGVCAGASLPAGGSAEIAMAMSWDMPTVVFGKGGIKHTKRYTRWFSGADAAADICQYALQNYPLWEQQIEAWQRPILHDEELPGWLKSALFNQLYYIADGGTVWLEIPDDEKKTLPHDDPRREYGRFAYLESHEYILYNTFDVHFYASWAVVMLWPELQRVLMYDMADYTVAECLDSRTYLNGEVATRKPAFCVPHDVGNPEDEPFKRINAYHAHNISRWKDLNPKLVLQVYRDYKIFGYDMKYVQHMWPVCEAVMKKSCEFDRDGDGLIENDGFADQTFDSWTMHGPSAYCGGLWLAALHVSAELAGLVGEAERQRFYCDMLSRAKTAFDERLWNGSYYNFDSCGAEHSSSIMADQLCGYWYLALCGEDDQVFEADRVRSSLQTIYRHNVQEFADGKLGAVNGWMPRGAGKDGSSLQSVEVWTGVTYALSATMVAAGMVEEGLKTSEGIYQKMAYDLGLAFETPEAITGDGHYRALGYMRPLSLWSIWRAWQLRKHQQRRE